MMTDTTALPRVLLAVGIMALVTYLPRMLPLTFMKRRINSRFLRSFLEYVPYAVLAAMTFPAILYSTATAVSAGVGLVAALLLAWRGRGLLTVALGACGAVLLTEQAMRMLHLL